MNISNLFNNNQKNVYLGSITLTYSTEFSDIHTKKSRTPEPHSQPHYGYSWQIMHSFSNSPLPLQMLMRKTVKQEQKETNSNPVVLRL
jgi:hypothetical protein